MTQRGTSWVLTGLLCIALAVAACDGGGQTAQEAPQPPPEPRIVKPVTTDGEIYYFPVTGDDYRASLSAFRKAHRELRCRYFGADDRVGPVEGYNRHHTLIVGHTIVCTSNADNAKNAQDETVP